MRVVLLLAYVAAALQLKRPPLKPLRPVPRGGGLQTLKAAAKDLVTVYGPIAVAFDFVTLQILGLIVFTMLTLKIVAPPEFIYKKVSRGRTSAKHGLNIAFTIAICETILLPFRLAWAVYMTPKIAALLPAKWRPKGRKSEES